MLSPGSTGVLPDAHPQNMHVGGSKGSISGNFAMAEADLLIVDRLARGVPGRLLRHRLEERRAAVININGDLADATHYNNTLALSGDISAVAERLAARLETLNADGQQGAIGCKRAPAKKAEWSGLQAARFAATPHQR